jgi:hypothetical protein
LKIIKKYLKRGSRPAHRGWLDYHHWLGDGFNHPIPAGMGWQKPPMAIGGGLATPNNNLLALGGGRTTLGGGRTTLAGHGIASATPDRPVYDWLKLPIDYPFFLLLF